MEKGYKKLIVWKKADDLAYMIYKSTVTFPKEENYGITSQIRRAAISIPTNIAEGSGRQNRKEFKQFINIALGSLGEVEYLLGLCCRLGYLNKVKYTEIEEHRGVVGSMLWKLFKSF